MNAAPTSSIPPTTPNPAELMSYRIYGHAVRDQDAIGFQAGFWLNVAGDPPQSVFPRTRAGNALFATAELAEAAGITFGLERARGLLREQRI